MKKKMIVFGGVDDDGKLHNSIYSLDLETKTWTIETTSGSKPVGRIGHTAFLIPGNKMLVFGGNGDKSMLNELLTYDISAKKWSILNPSGDIPVPRTSTIGSLVGNYLYIFGGIKYYGDIYGYLNDAYRYHIVNNRWEKIATQGKLNPRANFCAATSANGNYFLLHGYWELYHDDSVYLDSTNTWTPIGDSNSESLPMGRTHATTVTIIEGDETKIYLFAGNDGLMVTDLGFRNDIWLGVGSGF